MKKGGKYPYPNKEVGILIANTPTYIRNVGWVTVSLHSCKPQLFINGKLVCQRSGGYHVSQIPDYYDDMLGWKPRIRYWLMKHMD